MAVRTNRYSAVGIVVAATAGLVTLSCSIAGAAPPVADPGAIPPRTALSVETAIPGVRLGTANENEPRTGLSIVKLYLADYALQHGDRSAADRSLAERMIRYSDDDAASRVDTKYPAAIRSTAAEYRLAGTRSNGKWTIATTTTADVAAFLHAKQTRDPATPILGWMATAGRVAADGTVQDWGTARLPGVAGTKWGWSDIGPSDVASASHGLGFSVAAHTHGTTGDHNTDVLNGLPQLLIDVVLGR